MKTLRFAPAVVAVGALLSLAHPAEAQGNGQVFRLPAQSGGRQASQPIQRPQATSPSPAYPAYPSPAYPAYPAYPVAYTVLPAVVMSDGSIYANFGNGYVPVRQACSVEANRPRVVNGNDLLWNGGNPLTTTQPAPAQMTASQQMIHGPPRSVSSPLASACYRMDAYGPVVIVR